MDIRISPCVLLFVIANEISRGLIRRSSSRCDGGVGGIGNGERSRCHNGGDSESSVVSSGCHIRNREDVTNDVRMAGTGVGGRGRCESDSRDGKDRRQDVDRSVDDLGTQWHVNFPSQCDVGGIDRGCVEGDSPIVRRDVLLHPLDDEMHYQSPSINGGAVDGDLIHQLATQEVWIEHSQCQSTEVDLAHGGLGVGIFPCVIEGEFLGLCLGDNEGYDCPSASDSPLRHRCRVGGDMFFHLPALNNRFVDELESTRLGFNTVVLNRVSALQIIEEKLSRS